MATVSINDKTRLDLVDLLARGIYDAPQGAIREEMKGLQSLLEISGDITLNTRDATVITFCRETILGLDKEV